VTDLGLQNVEIILSQPDSTELSAASVDVAFVCDTYHHFDDPAPMLRSIRQALRDGGQLIVIDFERIPGNPANGSSTTFARERKTSEKN